MSISILNRGGASGGMTANIIVNGLSETDVVTASKDGVVKNGVWVNGHHEITGIKDLGLWTVTASNGEDTATQDVLVEVIGLYEIEMDYTVNYLMLYDYGDECEDVTGGWGIDGYSAPNASYTARAATKNTDSIYVYYASGGYCYVMGTLSAVDVTDYSMFGSVGKPTSVLDGTYGIDSNMLSSKTAYNSWDKGVSYISQGVQQFKVVDISNSTGLRYAYLLSQLDSKCSGNFYAVALFKADEWQTLCSKAGISAPADLATLIADTTSISAILASEDAVKYMVSKCTGDFMASFVASSACLSALNSSPYKSIVTANKHWAKFLAMVQ